MRRAYRQWLPVLARHYPGWDWSRIEEMPAAEIAEFIHQYAEYVEMTSPS